MRLYLLDLFRFFAAFSVVIYHYTARPGSSNFLNWVPLTQFGYLGVPLFFMISGFVITASAERRSPFPFLISRAARLYPAYWIGITFTVLTLLIFAEDGKSVVQLGQYLSNLTMFNHYLKFENIDGVYWTLQTELKFYGCVFVLLYTGLFHRPKVWLSIWAGVTLLHILTHQPFFMGWFISPEYSPQFISGVVFYLIWKEGIKPFTSVLLALSFAMCCFRAYEQAPSFMVSPDHETKLITILITGVFHVLFMLLATKKIVLKPSVFYTTLGGMTYPLYLVHNRAGKAIIDSLSPAHERVMVVFTTLLMFGVALLIYSYLETPLAERFKAFLEFLHEKSSAKKGRTLGSPQPL